MQQTPSPSARPVEAPQPYIVQMNEAVPRTAEEVRALQIKLRNLQDQLQNAAERRRSVSSQLSRAHPAALPGLEARLQALDSRILSTEASITTVERLLAAAPATATVGAAPPRAEEVVQRYGDAIVPLVAILSVFVLGPFSIAMARRIWRRSAPAAERSAVTDAATQNRLEQLQQSVDSIAIEVERISEGQRFVTKLLSDRAIAAGAAEPVRVPNKAAVPSERG